MIPSVIKAKLPFDSVATRRIFITKVNVLTRDNAYY